jgi:lysozyme
MADTFTDAVEARVSGQPVFLDEGLEILNTFEGFEPEAYYDLDRKKKKGTLTVGYGFTKYDIPGLKEGYRISQTEATKLLPNLVNRKYGPEVLKNVQVPLNDSQYSALASFAYNVGPTAFRNSTLLKKLNAGDYAGAASEFGRWTKAGGQEKLGLVRRRKAETALFQQNMPEFIRVLEEQKYGTQEQMLKKAKKLGDVSALTPVPEPPTGYEAEEPAQSQPPLMEGVDFGTEFGTQYANFTGLTQPAGINPAANKRG